jgi:hypothetical protein
MIIFTNDIVAMGVTAAVVFMSDAIRMASPKAQSRGRLTQDLC